MRTIISLLSIFNSLLVGAILVSCARPASTMESIAYVSTSASVESCISTGDIIVSNSGSDVVLVLKSDGTYKGVAYNVANNSESVYGLSWLASTGELLVAVDGADRIMAISRSNCNARIFIADGNLSGTLRGVTQLSGGDILVVETSNVERFNSFGFRITTGGWPKALQTAGTGIHAKSSSGFVHCSNTTDVVRVYDDTGTQTATVSSGIAGTTDAQDCRELTGGNIAVTWAGTTDTVSIYNSTLSSTVASYSNISVLSNPRGIAQRANGNILVLETTLNYIVELTSSAVFVNVIGDSVLSTPEFITVAP